MPRVPHYGLIEVTPSTCECGSWRSMRLPCRHILAVRASLEMNVFDETLCDPRWSLEYYKANQRIFLSNQEDFTQLSVAAPLLSQVSSPHWLVVAILSTTQPFFPNRYAFMCETYVLFCLVLISMAYTCTLNLEDFSWSSECILLSPHSQWTVCNGFSPQHIGNVP